MDDSQRLLGVALDLDGTIINSEDLYEQAGVEVLRRRGKTYDSMLREQIMGRPAADSLRVMIEHHALADPIEALMRECEEMMLEFLATSLAAMPGVYELLDELDVARMPYGVATSATRDYADYVLARLEIKQRCRFVLTVEDVRQGKPNPEIYLLAASRLQITARQMMVLEDSANGCQAGAAAGAFTVAVPNRHAHEHNFACAAFIADTLADRRIRQALRLAD